MARRSPASATSSAAPGVAAPPSARAGFAPAVPAGDAALAALTAPRRFARPAAHGRGVQPAPPDKCGESGGSDTALVEAPNGFDPVLRRASPLLPVKWIAFRELGFPAIVKIYNNTILYARDTAASIDAGSGGSPRRARSRRGSGLGARSRGCRSGVQRLFGRRSAADGGHRLAESRRAVGRQWLHRIGVRPGGLPAGRCLPALRHRPQGHQPRRRLLPLRLDAGCARGSGLSL